MQLFDRFRVVNLKGRPLSYLSGFSRGPIGPNLGSGGRGIESQDTTRLEFVQPFEYAMRRGHIIVAHVKSERVAVDFVAEIGMLPNGFQLGRKDESPLLGQSTTAWIPTRLLEQDEVFVLGGPKGQKQTCQRSVEQHLRRSSVRTPQASLPCPNGRAIGADQAQRVSLRNCRPRR